MKNVDRIISDLEKQRAVIERAISSLREIADLVGSGASRVAATPLAPRRKRRRLSAAGRRAISEATKKRWARKRAAESTAAKKQADRSMARRQAVKKSAAKKKTAPKATAAGMTA